ncbi:unnamed protein product [Penicillium salamii]|uniref:Zn(2)-C6 fungal-type domain-containing protein n=1 Tax=Penicillium salamii TaxID=1612424 RepID=A0A9W4JDU9_9EURO|nr:unnamed protein product [Penicillium salamii]CAG8202425.1 unnamed protein product [Penicillium salamii]CAG8210051.1 unnamed protein product [Penicillium salamii]CAG8227337.1 unnamed protein product [Penicillium salamii]CAG8241696.1 unnamed protein product [Penicillium salamii]
MTSPNGARPRVSKSCANCRAIKRRCDKQVPHCGQCIRTREVCGGYRSEWELHFRDQTGQTIKNSLKKEAEKKAKANSTSPPARSPSPNLDDIGITFFVNNFVAGGHSSSRGHLNYISNLYGSDGQHPTLVASMAAVGLVALANTARQPGMVSHARAKYSEAIQLVNAALASPVESLHDDILMSIISLGVFENTSNYASWSQHVQGAAALVVTRGKRQFTNPAAILMFNQVRADIVVACVHSNLPFPEDMRELQEEAIKYETASGAFWLLGVLASRHVDLLYKVRQRTAEFHWPELLQEATILQRDFETLFASLAIQEPYTTNFHSGGDPEVVYRGRYDIYHSSWAIRVWNNARMLQMITCNIIYFILTKTLTTSTDPVLRAHAKTGLQGTLQIQSKLENDMLATVPQALGYISSTSQPNSTVDFSSPASVSGSYLLTWVLYTVGQSTVVKSETRRWVIRRLEEIGRNAGLAVALQHHEDIAKLDQIQAEAENMSNPTVEALNIHDQERKIYGELSPPGWKFSPGDTILGHLIRHTPIVTPEAEVTILLTGRIKSRVIRRGHTKETFNVVYQVLDLKPETLYTGPLHLPEGSDEALSWPFELRIPTEASPTTHRLDPPTPQVLPGSFISTPLADGTQSKVEYCLKASLRYSFGRKNEEHDTIWPINICHPMPECHNRYDVKAWRCRESIRSPRLLSGMANSGLSVGQGIKKFFHTSSVPKLFYFAEITMPCVIQMSNPEPIAVSLNILPRRDETSDSIRDVPQEFKVNWINLIIHRKTEHTSFDIDHQKEVVELSQTRVLDTGLHKLFENLESPLKITTGKLNEPVLFGNLFQLTLSPRGLCHGNQLMVPGSATFPEFSTFRIIHTNSFEWHVSLDVAGETKEHKLMTEAVVIDTA